MCTIRTSVGHLVIYTCSEWWIVLANALHWPKEIEGVLFLATSGLVPWADVSLSVKPGHTNEAFNMTAFRYMALVRNQLLFLDRHILSNRHLSGRHSAMMQTMHTQRLFPTVYYQGIQVGELEQRRVNKIALVQNGSRGLKPDTYDWKSVQVYTTTITFNRLCHCPVAEPGQLSEHIDQVATS